MADIDPVAVRPVRPLREWRAQAIATLRREQAMAVMTDLIPMPLTDASGITLYIKDETAHPSGSLKHRLARSLFLHALCNGWIGPDTLVVEASSGSTAVSAAWFARLLDLDFLAVIPASTAAEKIVQIEAYGGRCHKVDDPLLVQDEAARIARDSGGHLLDQFTYAERVTGFKEPGSIAAEIFEQMQSLPSPVPTWLVCGAGTGGTAATLGRYARYSGHASRLCVADPEASVFHRHYGDRSITSVAHPISCIEGIGRPRIVPSFLPDVIDRMIVVPDRAGIAATHHLSALLGRPCGPSTGVNLHAALSLIAEMATLGETGSVVTLLCDSGKRYRSTCFDERWCADRGFSETDLLPAFDRFLPIAATQRGFVLAER